MHQKLSSLLFVFRVGLSKKAFVLVCVFPCGVECVIVFDDESWGFMMLTSYQKFAGSNFKHRLQVMHACLLTGCTTEMQKHVWLHASTPVLHMVSVRSIYVSWTTNHTNNDYFCFSVLTGAFTVCSSRINLFHSVIICLSLSASLPQHYLSSA